MTKQTRREAYKYRILVGKRYVKECIDDSDKLFTEEVEEAYANVLKAVGDYMNTIICRDDIDDATNYRLKLFVMNFETLFLPVFVSSKLKKKHLKKLFKIMIKHFDECNVASDNVNKTRIVSMLKRNSVV